MFALYSEFNIFCDHVWFSNDCIASNYSKKLQSVFQLYLPPPHMVQQPLVGQARFNKQASRSHSGTPQSVGLLWKSGQPDAEAST